jgi:hypothetical protein
MKSPTEMLRKVAKTTAKRSMSDGAKALSMWSNNGLVKFHPAHGRLGNVPGATCGRTVSRFALPSRGDEPNVRLKGVPQH